MCDSEFTENVIKCRDHSHITSKFRTFNHL